MAAVTGFTGVLCLLLLWQQPRDPYAAARDAMVREQIEGRGVRNKDVLKALRETPRHLFVPPEYREQAYGDHPIPIGQGQTISQPYVVALMTELLAPAADLTVLEIGTGSGYQAAILSELFAQVYSIELLPELARRADSVLRQLGRGNVMVRAGDGYLGWPEHAPFDRIILTAAPPRIPEALTDQLKPGGILVAPVGGASQQQLVVVEKTKEGRLRRREVIPVRFVPMVPAR
jgi:protein-L-isoaspartate(D-aspartate) O-methyltransferase